MTHSLVIFSGARAGVILAIKPEEQLKPEFCPGTCLQGQVDIAPKCRDET